jgi:hypothetical protein
VLALALCGSALAKKGPVTAYDQEVVVYVVDQVMVRGSVLSGAKEAVSDIFAKIGVHIRWENGNPPSTFVSCQNIVLFIQEYAPDDAKAGVMARTDLANDHIHVYYERIRPSFDFWPNFECRILTHVFAHEMGHALQGLNRHSQTGMMKAVWTAGDRVRIMNGSLPFAPIDVGLIHAGAVRCQLAAYSTK